MPLWIIGLGLGDEKDITIKGAEAISRCERVFLEAYTSILGVSAEKLVRGGSLLPWRRGRVCVFVCPSS